MARKSRKNLPEQSSPPVKAYDFVAGGYLRVSEKDRGSIETQKSIIQRYVNEHPDIMLDGFYVDDGKSSFINNRYAFNRLIADIESRNINCVIVKDISRFGRDDLETVSYIHKIFPQYGARFIAINDDYDSHSDSENLDFSFLLKNLVNYTYSKEISQKVSKVIKLKQKQGTYIGARVPYGYIKQKDGYTTHYVIDKYDAEIVRSIFYLASQGESGYDIASRLNMLNIPSPGNDRQGTTNSTHTLWTRNAVVSILRNKVYAGYLVTGKTKTNWWEMRKSVRVSSNKWIEFENHHEPIIGIELFQAVQQVLASREKSFIIRRYPPMQSPFVGKRLFCGDCGRKMKLRRVKDNIYWVCPRYTESRGACTSKRISEAKLSDAILDSILLEIENAAIYRDRQLEYEQSLAFTIKHNHLQKRETTLRNQIEEHSKSLRNCYEAFVSGIISRSDYTLITEEI